MLLVNPKEPEIKNSSPVFLYSISMFPIRTFLLFIVIAFSLSACNQPDAQQVVDLAIRYSGGEAFEKSRVEFDFRKIHYVIDRRNNDWKLQRIIKDSAKTIRDLYSPKGFLRFINEEEQKVPDGMALKYTESINSVAYFALLPYKLNDPAVQKEWLGLVSINDTAYHKIKVSFQQEGGGVDFEDVFYYWFDTKDYSLDYLAYSFQVNGGGLRFRKAYNERFIDQIRIVDYLNYRPKKELDLELSSLDQAYQNDQLELLSKIELEQVKVDY